MRKRKRSHSLRRRYGRSNTLPPPSFGRERTAADLRARAAFERKRAYAATTKEARAIYFQLADSFEGAANARERGLA